MTKYDERRAKIDAAAIHGNPAFGRDQLAALDAQSRVDIAEALTALVGILGDGYEPDPTAAAAAAGKRPDPEGGDDEERETDDEPDGEPLDVGDLVAASNNTGHELGEVVTVGVSEGRSWVQYEDAEGEVSGKVWADQLTRIDPAPAETEATNPADGLDERKRLAELHMANINDEPKVEYEQVKFEAGESGEFDVPIGMSGAPVVVKKAGK